MLIALFVVAPVIAVIAVGYGAAWRGVFTEDMIDAYIELKREDVERLNMTTHPVEFDMYYSV